MILKNEMLITKGKGEYLEVRYIAVKNSNREIGRNLAEIAVNEYNVSLSKYQDPLYGKARESYIKRNFPVLLERSFGVKDIFKIELDDTSFDASSLPYDLGDIACSAIYFPPSVTENGHPCVCRNLDWYEASVPELEELMVGKKGKPALKSLSRISIVEFYPDQGYNAVQLGSHDLLNPPMDGINEKGLFVCILSDLQGENAPTPFSGAKDAGLSFTQLTTLILNKCANVNDAKLEILQQRVYFPFRSQHFLIGDRDGNVTLFEVDGQSGMYYFIDGGPDEPFIVTNHSLHLFPNPSTFPAHDLKEEYNTFNRWNCLRNYLKKHEGLYNKEDMYEAMSLVYSHYKDPISAGASFPFIERSMYTHVADLAENLVEIKFYKKDGLTVDGSDNPTIIFHDPIKMTLNFN